MLYTKLAVVAAFSALAIASPNATPVEVRQNKNNGGGGAAAAAGGANGLTLLANAVQTGSASTGQEADADPAQALSQTSNNNFINFCSGKTVTNGLQNVAGSCNGIVMGDIPAKTKMVSSTIIFPPTGGNSVAADTTFNIAVQVANLVAGSFTNPDSTYYAAPQTLSGGSIVGHTHVTVQDLGNSLNPQIALDATKFAFFKGINDPGNGKGLLQATVTGGLPAGNYRVCTMSSASNHQPVLMPVAQRGAQDDCTKFVVGGGGGGGGKAAAAAGGKAAAATTAAAAAAAANTAKAATGAAAAGKAAGGAKAAAAGGIGGKGRGRGRKQRFARRDIIV